MRSLSISRAWDQSKVVLARDGRLFASVALALLVLPAAVLGAVTPGGLGAAIFAAFETSSPWMLLLITAAFLVILTGQLAVTRLAIAPSLSVGAAIACACRRLPAFVVVALLTGLILLFAGIICAVVLGLTVGTSASEQQLASSPLVYMIVMVLFLLYLFLVSRIVWLAAAVTTVESLGPIRAIARSWSLSAGHSWRLFGFVVVFIIGTGIALFAISSAIGFLLGLFLGTIEPLSASALVLALVDGVASAAVTVVLAVMFARIYVQLASVDEAQAPAPNSGI